MPPANDDYFILRQPKFEIITPPQAVLPDHAIPPVTVQTTRLTPTIRTEVVVHADSPQYPIPRTRLNLRPLPREPSTYSDGEGYGRSSSFSRPSSMRRLPPVPRGPRPTVLPSVVEERGNLPPPYPPVTAHYSRYSVSSSVPSHSYSTSIDSTASGPSLMSGSALLGSTSKGSLKLKDDDFQSEK